MTPEESLKRLAKTAASLDQVEVPSAPGVYAWFLAEGATLGR